MHSLPLSAEQKSLLAQVYKFPISLIEYYDYDNATRAILALLYQQVNHQKSTLLVVDSSQQMEYYFQTLNSMGLQDFIIKAGDNHEISATTINKWRSYTIGNKNELSQDIDKRTNLYLLNREQAVLERNKITQQYTQLNKKVLGEKRISTIAHSIGFKRMPALSFSGLEELDQSDLNLNQPEWQSLSQKIIEAKSLYNSDYKHLSDLVLLSENCIAKYKLDDLVVSLKTLIENLSQEELFYKNLRLQYDQELRTFFDQAREQSLNKLDEILVELNTVIKPSDQTLSRQLSDLNILLEKLGIEPVSNNIGSQENSVLTSKLVSTKDKLQQAQRLIDKKIKQYKSRVKTTDLSIDDQSNLDQVKTSITKVNKMLSNPKLELRIDDTILNKQDKIRSCIEDLKKQLYLINAHRGLIIWQKFLLNLKPVFKNIIICLTALPINLWEEISETWYNTLVLRQESLNQKPGFNKIKNLISKFNALEREQIELLKATVRLSRFEAIDALKSNHPNLYTSLIRKKVETNIPLHDLMLSSQDFLSGLYPIVIVNKSQFQSLKFAKTKLVDKVLFADSEIIAKLNLSTLYLAEYLSIFSPVSNRLSKDPQVVPYLQKGATSVLQNSQIPDSVNSSSLENVSIVKKVAKTLLSLQSELKIYHSRNLSIISCCTGTFDQLIRQMMDQHEVKELYGTRSIEDRLVEALLSTEKDQYIILQDGLINSSQVDTLRYQIDLIAKVSALGLSLIDLWTVDAIKTHHRNNINKINSIFKKSSAKNTELAQV